MQAFLGRVAQRWQQQRRDARLDRRAVVPADIAATIAWLASPDSSCVAGASIDGDGGKP